MSLTSSSTRPEQRTGVVLINLGTPDSPSTRDVRRYLREFLGDPDVIELQPIARWLLLNLVILPFRPRRSAHAYQQIWSERGSPLAFHSQDLAAAVAGLLGRGFELRLAMRYGSPSIASALRELRDSDTSRIIAVPLFPHESNATTGSVRREVTRCASALGLEQEIEFTEAFYDGEGFIDTLTSIARAEFESFAPDHVVFSYHGLPEKQVRAADPSHAFCLASENCCDSIDEANANCYRAQCFATTRAAASALGLAAANYSVAFQSRLGRTPWLQPYLEERLDQLAEAGVERLAIVCPSFVADCLETLEEIGIRARDRWTELSGGELALVPCVNSSEGWTRALTDLIRGPSTSSGSEPPR